VKIWSSPVVKASYTFLIDFFKLSDSFMDKVYLKVVNKISDNTKFNYKDNEIESHCLLSGKYCISSEASKKNFTFKNKIYFQNPLRNFENPIFPLQKSKKSKNPFKKFQKSQISK